MAAERRFDALGTSVEVSVPDEAEALLDVVEQRLRDVEARWSRFRPDSELSILNAAMGSPCRMSPETLRLLRLAVEGYELTEGIFDPRVLTALEEAGYLGSHETLPVDSEPPDTESRPTPAQDVPRLQLALDTDEVASTATLPIGERWDLGGIGKGFAADLVTEDLAARGVESIMVNLGGDIRVFGAAPAAPCWTVRVDDPRQPGVPCADVHLVEGGVATSSRTKRRWVHDGVAKHHVIDPRTGRSAETDLLAVTVVAGATWWAEVLAKAALILGAEAGRALIDDHGCSAALIDVAGEVVVVGDHVRVGVAT